MVKRKNMFQGFKDYMAVGSTAVALGVLVTGAIDRNPALMVRGIGTLGVIPIIFKSQKLKRQLKK